MKILTLRWEFIKKKQKKHALDQENQESFKI